MPLFRVETFRLTEEKPKVNYVKVVPGEDADFWERAEVLVLAALVEYVNKLKMEVVIREDSLQRMRLVVLPLLTLS